LERLQIYKTSKKTEIELLKAKKKKAEESDWLKLAFSANMSHEIRTPMNGIFVVLLNFWKEPKLTGKKQQNILIIEKSGKRMLNIINDIIDISKVESGKLLQNRNGY
jgi:signal transduction histidine kinase